MASASPVRLASTASVGVTPVRSAYHRTTAWRTLGFLGRGDGAGGVV